MRGGIVIGSVPSRRQALADRFPAWTPRALGAFLDDCAGRYGDRPLILTDERTVSYQDAADWSLDLADGLAELGVRPGDRVGLLMANHLEFAPLKFAIARTGAVAIPFNYLYRSEELAYVL